VTWTAEHVRLDSDEEAGATKYDPHERPRWQGVLRAAADPEVRQITIPASTQVGKTLTLIALLIYLARNSPARALVVLPDQDLAAGNCGHMVPSPIM
jgi:phage terminase large subunit GpA-like protein